MIIRVISKGKLNVYGISFIFAHIIKGGLVRFQISDTLQNSYLFVIGFT